MTRMIIMVVRLKRRTISNSRYDVARKASVTPFHRPNRWASSASALIVTRPFTLSDSTPCRLPDVLKHSSATVFHSPIWPYTMTAETAAAANVTRPMMIS